jgi:hypothetical protein
MMLRRVALRRSRRDTSVGPAQDTKAEKAALKRIWLFAGMVLGVYLSAEFLLFRTSFYPSLCKPDSTTGRFEAVLRSERERRLKSRHEVLVVGDSRIAEGFSARVANSLSGETGFHFSSGALGGAGPRVWYYLLRDLDPDASRYQVIVLAMEDFSDRDRSEDLADRLLDLRYVIRRLTFSDLPEFAASFPTPEKQFQVLLGAIFKGLTYKRDLQDFLGHPVRRFVELDFDRLKYPELRDSYGGHAESLAGLEVDWQRESLRNADRLTSVQKAALEDNLFSAGAPQRGHSARYRRQWLTKIVERYQSTSTRIVFVRLPQGPYVRPGTFQAGNNTVIRGLVRQGYAQLVEENYFDQLQRPELFFDGMNLNREGRLRFSVMLARLIAERLK